MNNTTVTEVLDLSVTQDVATQIFGMTVTSEAMAKDPHCGDKDWNECEFVRTWKNVHFSLTLTFDVFTLFILLFLRNHKTFIQRIFLNILICNILEAISVLMNDGTKIESCIPAGFGVQYFGFVQFLWVCSLTIYVSLILLVNKDTKRHEKRYRVICWVVPLVLALIPFLPLPADKPEDLVVPYFTSGNTSYGMFYAPAGAFCWVIGGETGHVSHPLRAILWWVPVMTGVLVIFLMCAYLMIKGTRGSFAGGYDRNHREHRKLIRKYLRPMAAYGAASTVMHVFMMTDRIHTWVMNEPSFVARILHTIGYAGYGMVLCALFYILCGRKEFRKAKWIKEWKYHKRRFLCRKIKDILELTVVPQLHAAVSGSDPQQSSSRDTTSRTPSSNPQPQVATITKASLRVCQPEPSLNEESHRHRYANKAYDYSQSSYYGQPISCTDDDLSTTMGYSSAG